MGLLDSLMFSPSAYGGQGGGLLDMLRNIQTQQQYQPSDGFGLPMNAQPAQGQMSLTPDRYIPVGDYQMPQFGNPMPAAPAPVSAPTPAAPVTAPVNANAQMPSAQEPDRLGAGLQGFLANLHTGPLGSIIGGLGGAITGQAPPTPASQQRSLYSSLVQAGVPAPQAMAAVQSGNSEILKSMLDKYSKQDRFRPATDEERKAAGLDSGLKSDTPLYINTATGEPKFGPPQTNVNVSTEKTGQAELATKGVNAYVEAQAAGRESQKRVALYDAMERAAQGFTPGATAEARLTAKRYLKDLGLIRGEDVPDGEIMQMISRTLGIHAQPKGQGSVSNYERELFAKSLPNMSQSPEGLKMAINISRKLETFDQKVAEIYRESARANKGLPNYLEVQDKIAALGSPLSDREMGALQGGSAAAPAAAPAQPRPWQNIGNGIKIRPKG